MTTPHQTTGRARIARTGAYTLTALVLLGPGCAPGHSDDKHIAAPTEHAAAPTEHAAAPDGHAAPVSLMPAEHAAATEQAHWSYQGEGGPDEWANLSSEYQACDDRSQSPIDLPLPGEGEADSLAMEFSYQVSVATIENNGHAIVVHPSDGGALVVDGHRYNLKQFHFHVPSEHAMGGQRWDATAHLVHADKDGNLAVVGVQLQQGEPNSFLETLQEHMPGERHAELALGLHMADFLPAEREFYTYSGSLTTPPCSEGVRWFVLYNPVELSPAQLDQFKKYHAFNARPLQPVNEREIDHVVAVPAGQ